MSEDEHPATKIRRQIALSALAQANSEAAEVGCGFTREDVQHLRDMGNALLRHVKVGGVFGHDWANSIADRIEALLPPP